MVAAFIQAADEPVRARAITGCSSRVTQLGHPHHAGRREGVVGGTTASSRTRVDLLGQVVRVLNLNDLLVHSTHAARTGR